MCIKTTIDIIQVLLIVPTISFIALESMDHMSLQCPVISVFVFHDIGISEACSPLFHRLFLSLDVWCFLMIIFSYFGRNISQVIFSLQHTRKTMMSTFLINGGINCNHLVKLVTTHFSVM